MFYKKSLEPKVLLSMPMFLFRVRVRESEREKVRGRESVCLHG